MDNLIGKPVSELPDMVCDVLGSGGWASRGIVRGGRFNYVDAQDNPIDSDWRLIPTRLTEDTPNANAAILAASKESEDA